MADQPSRTNGHGVNGMRSVQSSVGGENRSVADMLSELVRIEAPIAAIDGRPHEQLGPFLNGAAWNTRHISTSMARINIIEIKRSVLRMRRAAAMTQTQRPTLAHDLFAANCVC